MSISDPQPPGPPPGEQTGTDGDHVPVTAAVPPARLRGAAGTAARIVPPAPAPADSPAGGTTLHQHGTRDRYLRGPNADGGPGGCRCDRCRKANTAAANRRRMAIDAGTHRTMVDAEPVRQHVLKLKAAGLSYQRVAQLAGVHREAINNLLYGKRSKPPTQRMHPDRAAAILAVKANGLPAAGWVSAIGTRRRIQALAAIGWPGRRVASLIGISQHALTRITGGSTTRCQAETARRVRDAYDRLWKLNPADHGVSAGSVAQARRSAAERGWVSPLAWDDALIDDPEATPILSATPEGDGKGASCCTECGHGGVLRRGWCLSCYHRWRDAGKPKSGPPPGPAAIRENFAWLIEQGETVENAAQRVGIRLSQAEAWVSAVAS